MALATRPSRPELFPKEKKGKNRDGVNATSFPNLTTVAFVLFPPRCASVGIERHNCSRFERPHRLSKTQSAHKRDQYFHAASLGKILALVCQ